VDELDRAINEALAAARAFPSVAPRVEHAAGLARFQRRESRGPYREEPLSPGVPQPPEGPLFPWFESARGEPELDPLYDALEALQHQLVWAADCAEFTDATRNAEQFLRAAGHLNLAAQAAVTLAGAGLGLVLVPTTHVRDLAAGLGLQVSDLIGDGETSMGSLTASHVRATYRWDLYHEEPVRSADDLAWRELTSYTVRFAAGRARLEGALHTAHGEPRDVAARRQYGPFFVDAADTHQFTLEWYAEAPDWAIPPADHDERIAALVDGLRTARTTDDLAALPHAIGNGGFEYRPRLPARELARAFGAPDAFARTVDVHMSSWRLATPGGDLEFAGWRIEAALVTAPSCDAVPGISLPAARTAALTDDDGVRYVYVRPARASASRSA
jgi:hypothetical protein